MPNPKRRFSHQRTALRRTNYKAVLPEIELNKQVGGEQVTETAIANARELIG